jgi:tRNA threonylcarbamoyladenosine biosynthesis protein TsaE
MESKFLFSHSVDETLQVAQTFSKNLKKGDVIGLQGDLGSGKTVFAKGVISQLTGVFQNSITSPTFTIIEEYLGDYPVFHVDLYRLENEKEVMDLSWDEMFGPNAITLIEWPERSNWVLSHCKFCVKLVKKNHKTRKIQIIKRKD